MEIIIQPTPDAASNIAARIIAQLVRRKPDCVLGLATGSTPLGTYRELARMHREDGLDFSGVTTFNLDEYVALPPEHPQSYHAFMDEHFFRHVNVPRGRIHIPDGMARDVPAECARYEMASAAAGGKHSWMRRSTPPAQARTSGQPARVSPEWTNVRPAKSRR